VISVIPRLTKWSWIALQVSFGNTLLGWINFGHQKRGMTIEEPDGRAVSTTSGLLTTSASTFWVMATGAVEATRTTGFSGDFELEADVHSLPLEPLPLVVLTPLEAWRRVESGLPGGLGAERPAEWERCELGLGEGASKWMPWMACVTIFCDSGKQSHSQKNSSSFD
jgi:hypothetical protein